jgi:hypothetical protein
LCKLADDITGRQEKVAQNISLPKTFIQDVGNEFEDAISTRRF